MRLVDIRGQEQAMGTLSRALSSNRVPHAYLFSGPAGVGKHLAATALAKALNCETASNDACGHCLSCSKIDRHLHPDVFEIGLPEKKKRIPIDAIRELDRRLASRPHEGRAKVAVIDPADRMTEPAANAMLKTLEEPRQGSFLVLITGRASSLLPTVRSRCQRVRFRPLPEKTVQDLLVNQGVPPEEASTVAALSAGSMEQAAVYLSEDLGGQIDALMSILKSAIEPLPTSGLEVAASLSKNRDDAIALLDLMTIFLAEIAWIATHPEESQQRVLLRHFGDQLHLLAEKIPIARIGAFVAAVHRAKAGIENNNMNVQLALEGMVISMRNRSTEIWAGSGFSDR